MSAGNVVELDPALVTERPTQRLANVDSDHRFLGAPLPALQVGAVVEQEIVTTDRGTVAHGYEQLGLAADATAAYKRVTRSEIDLLLSAYMLAERRLAAMGVAP